MTAAPRRVRVKNNAPVFKANSSLAGPWTEASRRIQVEKLSMSVRGVDNQ